MTNSYLPHNSVPWQVSTDPPGAARSVQSLGTTANPSAGQANPEWWADLEYIWRIRTAPARERLEARCKVQYRNQRTALAADMPARAVMFARSAEWNDHRARAIALARADVVATCRKRWRQVACGCMHKEIIVGCDAPQLCEWCRKRHWRKWRHRITRAMKIHVGAARGAWNQHRRGMMPGVYLITLTGPHSGDLETDRKAMGEAWRKLSKVAHARNWWGAYALTWEATMGNDGRGHMHAHVAVVSSWVPFDELHAAWRVAMPGALVVDVQSPNRSRNEAGRAANYLAKYVTKGVDPTEMTGRKAGELLCAFRGRRKVTTSARFWSVYERTGTCKLCKQPHRSTGAPCALQDIAPGAVLRSMAERAGWFIPRGEPQVSLRWRPEVPDGVIG